MKLRVLLVSAITCVTLLVTGTPVRHTLAAQPLPVWDNFKGGFTTGTAAAKWFYFSAGPAFTGDDGTTRTGRDGGLLVVSKGTNPTTGLPAFTKTVGQSSGLPGAFDHVKWLVYANHTATSGNPGFDAPPSGQELVCQSTISGQTFGTAANPFGSTYVANANDDLRLASVAMPVIDFGTYSVFDTFVTNQHIYAFYEHLPFLRADFGGPYPNYASFSSAIPIASRKPGSVDTVALAYDKAKGTARWLVNGVEKFRVGVGTPISPIGAFPPSQFMLLDHGGTGTLPLPNQLDCGMGMFTLLDGYGKGGKGLVQLDANPNIYLDPTKTDGTLENFVDPTSAASNRLWGQGAALEVGSFSIGYQPSGS